MTENRRIVIEKEDGTHLEECIVSLDEAKEVSVLIKEMMNR